MFNRFTLAHDNSFYFVFNAKKNIYVLCLILERLQNEIKLNLKVV